MSALAAGIAASAATVGSLINSATTNSINESTKNWQSNENRYAREWQEDMYNKYYSPQAIRNQLLEAGINPAINGQSVAPVNMPSPSQTASPAVGFPHVDFGANEAINAYLQSSSISAQNQSYRAQSIENLVRAGTMIAKDLGEGVARDYFRTMLPTVVSDQKEQFNVQRLMDGQLMAVSVSNQRSKLEYDLRQRFGEKQTMAELDKVDQWITESVSRIGKMASDSKLNEANINKVASEIANNLASANLSLASANQINKLLPYMQSKVLLENGLLGLSFGSQEAVFAGDSKIRDFLHREEIQDDRVKSWMANPENRIETKIWQLIFQDLLRSGTTIGAASILSR